MKLTSARSDLSQVFCPLPGHVHSGPHRAGCPQPGHMHLTRTFASARQSVTAASPCRASGLSSRLGQLGLPSTRAYALSPCRAVRLCYPQIFSAKFAISPSSNLVYLATNLASFHLAKTRTSSEVMPDFTASVVAPNLQL